MRDRIKLVLIINRKSQMGIRLVRKTVTLKDLEWRNGRYFALFYHRIQQIRGADIYVKILSVTEM